VKIFPVSYGVRRFKEPTAETVESSQHIYIYTITLRSILILFSSPLLNFSYGLVPSGFWTEILYTFLIAP